MEPSDTQLLEDAKKYVRKIRGRFYTYRRGAIRDGETVLEPYAWLRQKMAEETYNRRFHIETRQNWSRIEKLSPAKRRLYFKYVGELLTKWTMPNHTVTIREAISYSYKYPQQKTMRADVRQTKKGATRRR